VTAFVIAVAEETGWRAFALPRLAAKHGAFVGSCILGVLWALWHVPMFIAVDVPISAAPVMLLYFVGGSLYFAFLYIGTGGSLFIAVLAHIGAHLNNSHAALPGDTLPLLVHAVVYAALGLAAMRSTAFERAPAIRSHIRRAP
jgi:membrane protease YdiL (CAAX protease family)